MWEKRNDYKVLVGKREGKRPHGPRRPRLEDVIKMHFKKLPWKDVGWIYPHYYRNECVAVVNTEMNYRVS